MEAAASAAPIQPNYNDIKHNNATNIEACFGAGLDLSEFGGATSSISTTTSSASAALAKIKRDASAKIQREEGEEAALERRVAAVGSVAKHSYDESNNDVKEIIPRALHPNSQPSSLVGEERNSNFIQFQTSGGQGDFLSSLVTTHKTEGREISNKSRMMLKSNSKGKVKMGQWTGKASMNNVRQKASGKSVVKKSKKSKRKF